MGHDSVSDELLDTIVDGGVFPSFMTQGDHDVEGNQIFTPDFVCNGMFKMIGLNEIKDINNTILEPASGDGAFTVRILDLRLKAIDKDPDYFKKSLIALSTIFSIEMDEALIKKQRNNIFSVLMLHAKKHKDIPEGYEWVAKKTILTNFIWGETNIDTPIKYVDDPIGWYMPTTPKNKIDKNKIKFARWTITDNLVESSYVLEDWEAEQGKEDFSSLGGLFDYAE